MDDDEDDDDARTVGVIEARARVLGLEARVSWAHDRLREDVTADMVGVEGVMWCTRGTGEGTLTFTQAW